MVEVMTPTIYWGFLVTRKKHLIEITVGVVFIRRSIFLPMEIDTLIVFQKLYTEI